MVDGRSPCFESTQQRLECLPKFSRIFIIGNDTRPDSTRLDEGLAPWMYGVLQHQKGCAVLVGQDLV